MREETSAEERLLENGYEGVKILSDFGYDTALIGVTDDNRAVYDYMEMVNWLIFHEEMTMEDAVEWLEYNTIRSLPYFGDDGPIVVHMLEDLS